MSNWSISIAITLWYIFGVLSISTSKIILQKWYHYGVTPLLLTLQQLFIGVNVLGFFLFNNMGFTMRNKNIEQTKYYEYKKKKSSIFYSIYIQAKDLINISWNTCNKYHFKNIEKPSRRSLRYLLLSSLFFTMGFIFTNYGFHMGHASFVESVKSSEPMTSFFITILWGLEQPGYGEFVCLVGICFGVTISTIGNIDPKEIKRNIKIIPETGASKSIQTCLIVFTSNICFSIRGLYQKFYRTNPYGSISIVDDTNFQYRIHLFGVLMLGMYIFFLHGLQWILNLSFFFSNER